MQAIFRTTNWRYLAIILLLFLIVQILWLVPAALYPLTILATIFHELSHGLAAILSGGQIVEMSIYANGSGVAVTRGGSQLLISPAGYLGATLISAMLLLTVRWRRAGRVLLYALAALLVVSVVLWIRGGFGMFFTVLLAAAFAGVAWKAPPIVIRWLNPLLAAGLLREALDAAWGLVRFAGTGQVNDAVILASRTGVPPTVYSVTWTVLALAITLFAIFIATRRSIPESVALARQNASAPAAESEPRRDVPAAPPGDTPTDRGSLLRELEEQGLVGPER